MSSPQSKKQVESSSVNNVSGPGPSREAQLEEYHREQVYIQQLEVRRAEAQALLDETEKQYNRANVGWYDHLQEGEDKRSAMVARTRRGSAAAHTIGNLADIQKACPNVQEQLAKQREALGEEAEETKESPEPLEPPAKRKPGRPKKSASQPQLSVPRTPQRTASQQLRDTEISSSPQGSKTWNQNRDGDQQESEDEERENRWSGKK